MVSVAKVEKVDCSKLLRHRHSVGERNYHLQFTPNFRKPVFLLKEVRELCKQAFEQKAAQLGIIIYCVNLGLIIAIFLLATAENILWRNLPMISRLFFVRRQKTSLAYCFAICWE
ncbi:MAG: hypothetical protein QXT45_00990 [Candidatus Bilamarchaeaceae archaeon]